MIIKSLGLTLFFASSLVFATAQDSAKITTKPGPVTDADKVFTKVDKPAAFPGGEEGWAKYLTQNLKYPKKAVRQNIQGIVRVQFLVDKEGNISEVAALNDPGGGLMEEAIRIFQKGPKWIPAEQNGKRVIYRHIQAISFRLE